MHLWKKVKLILKESRGEKKKVPRFCQSGPNQSQDQGISARTRWSKQAYKRRCRGTNRAWNIEWRNESINQLIDRTIDPHVFHHCWQLPIGLYNLCRVLIPYMVYKVWCSAVWSTKITQGCMDPPCNGWAILIRKCVLGKFCVIWLNVCMSLLKFHIYFKYMIYLSFLLWIYVSIMSSCVGW